MKLVDKINTKIKNDERFIAKMILAGVLATSIPALVGGVWSCHNSVKDNPDNYVEDSRYIAGMVAVTAGTTFGSAGVMGCIDSYKNTNEDASVDDCLQR